MALLSRGTVLYEQNQNINQAKIEFYISAADTECYRLTVPLDSNAI